MIDLEKLREKMEGKHEAGVELIGVPPLQIVELIDLIASFEKDAARYRLRLETIRDIYPNAPSDCELDIAIGAALQSQEAAMGNPIAQQNQQVASPVVLPEPRWHNPSPHNAAHFPYYTPDDVRALLAQANAAGAQAVPDFCHVASLKLKSLQERGYAITGYAIEKAVDGAQPERGFISNGGFVGWWWDGQSPQADARDAEIESAVLAERERICAAIKAEDDHCVTQGDYMLDSDDCIKVARGEWERPVYDAAVAAAKA